MPILNMSWAMLMVTLFREVSIESLCTVRLPVIVEVSIESLCAVRLPVIVEVSFESLCTVRTRSVPESVFQLWNPSRHLNWLVSWAMVMVTLQYSRCGTLREAVTTV